MALGPTPALSGAHTVDGVAAIDGLPAGKYRITATLPNYQPFSTQGTTEPGETIKGTIKLTPQANAGLEVKVLDSRDRHALSGAVVKIDGETAASKTTVDDWAKFTNLYAGTYQIEISADAYRSMAGQRDIAPGDTVRGKILLQPIAGRKIKKTKAKKAKPDQRPQKDPNACYAPIAKQIAELRAVNLSQNWQSGSVSVRTLGRDGQCIAGLNQCLQRTKIKFDACPPNAKGTYEQCQQGHAKAWVDCANQELDCEDKKALQDCGM